MNSKIAKSPDDRIISFITDWHKCWSVGLKMAESDERFDFDIWDSMIEEIERVHFVEGGQTHAIGSFEGERTHNPDTEKITFREIHGNSAIIYTEIITQWDGRYEISNYVAYDLLCSNENWLIVEITMPWLANIPLYRFLRKPKNLKLLMDKTSINVPVLNEELLYDAPFQYNGKELVQGKFQSIKLEQVGYIQLKSGIIGCYGCYEDGRNFCEFEPLKKRVRPGIYPIETSYKDCFVRIKFNTEKQVIKWAKANTVCRDNRNENFGAFLLFDALSLTSAKHYNIDKIIKKWRQNTIPSLHSIIYENDIFITGARYEEAFFLTYWGLDENNEVVSLELSFYPSNFSG